MTLWPKSSCTAVIIWQLSLRKFPTEDAVGGMLYSRHESLLDGRNVREKEMQATGITPQWSQSVSSDEKEVCISFWNQESEGTEVSTCEVSEDLESHVSCWCWFTGFYQVWSHLTGNFKSTSYFFTLASWMEMLIHFSAGFVQWNEKLNFVFS